MTRNPIKDPKIGDKWERTYFYMIIDQILDDNIKLTEFRKKDNSFSCKVSYSFDEFQKRMNWKGYDCWWFINNEKEKEMTNTENQTDRERAITSPQVGDRWEWKDGLSAEIFFIPTSISGNKMIWLVGSDRQQFYWSFDSWRQFVHAAKFMGNFVSKSQTLKRDPLKNPKIGDKWEVTDLWYNYKEVVYKGQHLIITNVEPGTKGPYIHGYFTNGSVFNCSVSEFPARSQVFKFVGNINE